MKMASGAKQVSDMQKNRVTTPHVKEGVQVHRITS